MHRCRQQYIAGTNQVETGRAEGVQSDLRVREAGVLVQVDLSAVKGAVSARDERSRINTAPEERKHWHLRSRIQR